MRKGRAIEHVCDHGRVGELVSVCARARMLPALGGLWWLLTGRCTAPADLLKYLGRGIGRLTKLGLELLSR